MSMRVQTRETNFTCNWYQSVINYVCAAATVFKALLFLSAKYALDVCKLHTVTVQLYMIFRPCTMA